MDGRENGMNSDEHEMTEQNAASRDGDGGTGRDVGWGRADGPGRDGGSGGPGQPVDSGGLGDLGDLGGGEEALRRLLHQAVADIEPRDGALQHLRRAVPARAARRRQALVGAVAAAVLVGTAVPALVHVTRSPGGAEDRPSIAGHGQDAHGGTSEGQGPDEGAAEPKPTPSLSKPPKDEKDGGETGGSTPSPGERSATPEPENTMAASSPSCGAAELGDATAVLGAPEPSGAVYGTFRIANISGGNCTVDGPGTVVTLAQGSADPARVNVVDHTAGDAATGLPDPSTEVAALVLQPGSAYEVRFAWVPAEGCPTAGDGGGSGGGGGEPSPEPPTPSASAENPDDTETTDESGMTTQLGTEDGTPSSGSITVTHTPEPGGPSAATTIGDACAGTVYRTGILAGS